MINKPFLLIFVLLLSLSVQSQPQPLKISSNKRYFITADGKPFFWLGDTGWLLFVKCNRQEAIEYLNTRQAQGFNVIQVMVLHELKESKNIYGDSAFINQDISRPRIKDNNLSEEEAYDYWDHIEFIVDEAAKRNMYMAMVPVWGSNIKNKSVNEKQAEAYAHFLAERFKTKPNIIWVNGGDIKGDVGMAVWNKIGETLHQSDSNHLICFHPRGRHTSSLWFHQQDWLAFNMVQSGHKDYAQDTVKTDPFHFGEDNWRYIEHDYKLSPVKPVIDAEPSYENIPHGLHDSLQPRWTAADLRRYAYWSVFAGGAGFTYGENAVMQFHKTNETSGTYGVTTDWEKGLTATGAAQMQFLKKLMESKNYFTAVPDQSLVNNQGERYNYLAAIRGADFAFIYTYTGRVINVNLGKLTGKKIKCCWYNPRNGQYNLIDTIANAGVKSFTPPGKEENGNDWVLVMESVK